MRLGATTTSSNRWTTKNSLRRSTSSVCSFRWSRFPAFSRRADMTERTSAAIFVVDDDVGLLRLIEKSLRREGYSIATAGSASEAMAWLKDHRPDLILLDLKLGNVEGKEIVEQLASTNRLVPFIVITGQGDERVAVEMMKRGALDYLVKDVNFQELVPTIVRRALDQIERDRRLASADQERKHLEQQILEISEREQRRIGQDL